MMPIPKYEQGYVPGLDEEDDLDDDEVTFSCTKCPSKFVTEMSLTRHMILHEEEEEEEEGEEEMEEQGQNGEDEGMEEQGQNEGIEEQQEEDEESNGEIRIKQEGLLEEPPEDEESQTSSELQGNGYGGSLSSLPCHSHNLLESILRNGRAPENQNSSFKMPSSSKPIPNLKPIPSLIQLRPNQYPQPDRTFQCNLCGVFFRKKEDLSRHVTRTHGNAKFTCPYCHRNISRRDHLKRHIKNVHPEFCTATEVGPFLNQGAGRPPKQLRSDESPFMQEEEQPIIKKFKISPSANGNGMSLLNHAKIQKFIEENQNRQQFEDDEEDNQEGQQYYDDEEEQEQQQHINEENGQEQQYYGVGDESEESQDQIDVEYGFNNEAEGEDNSNDYEQHQDNGNGNQAGINGILNGFMGLGDDGQDENGDSNEEQKFLGQEDHPSFDRKYKCELCDAAFMSKLNMERHMSTHSDVRPFKCSVCGKGFLRKEHLTKHLSSVHSGLKYRCQFCRKDISRKDHLLRHIRNCHPQEFMNMSIDMIDSEPQMISSSAIQLNGNSKIRVAALSCDMCPETFNHIDELMEHQSEAHGDVRKFKCEECPKAFKRKEHLIKHLSTHSHAIAAAAAGKTFACTECSDVFPTFEMGQLHIQEVHAKVKKQQIQNLDVPCNLCDNKFPTRVQLVQHLKAYHGVSNPERQIMLPSSSPSPGPSPSSIRLPRVSGPPIKIKPNHIPPLNNYAAPQRSQYHNKQHMTSIFNMVGPGEDTKGFGSLMASIQKGNISVSVSTVGH